MQLLQFLKNIKQSLPCLWEAVEYVNGKLVRLLYGRAIDRAFGDASQGVESTYAFRRLGPGDAGLLGEFIRRQPEGFDRYFKPHKFDLETFTRVLKSGTYFFIGAFDGERLVGYCFMRLFINKSAFRGYIVDSACQGRGIAKYMGLIMTEVCHGARFRGYATISKNNLPSLRSQMGFSRVTVLKELDDNYLYVKINKFKNDLGGGNLITSLRFVPQEGLLYAAC